MNSKPVNIVVITCLLTLIQFCRASASNSTDGQRKDSALRVYLPREVTIKDNTVRLDQVSIIRGEEALVARAGRIPLGRISVPGQKIAFDRSVVLSRLACNGIPRSKVTLTGAEKITVKRQHHIIKGNEFIELASAFLKKNPPAGSVCQFNPIRIPKDLVVPVASKDIKLSPCLAKGSTRSQAKVRIVAFADGKQVGARVVTFRLKYNCRAVVALADIAAGAVISAENVKIEKTLSNYPEPANWRPPYGLIARRRLPANRVIRPDMVGPVKPTAIIGRNQTVVIRIEKPGLLVTAMGKAMQEAGAGECIRVQNVDSKRIILARVNEDGTVEPIFGTL